jgi:DNA invertase Pin-like site-specific DNA recombinase
MWWKRAVVDAVRKAVTYYRHSAQDRQENSIPLQREQVHAFAREHGIEIVCEFADFGKSGLSTEGRDEFNRMLEEYVIGGKEDFDLILVLDVSRWGRFQDIDLSAYYSGLCRNYGKEVVYTTIGFPKEDDPIHFVYLNFERYRAASYSRELSTKVFKGCAKIAEQGFRAGGTPPYGLERMLLDERRNPVRVLQPGERKAIQNQRVTLTPGTAEDVKVVQGMFRDFLQRRRTPAEIAQSLNTAGVPSPGGKKWGPGAIRSILTNELYTGTMVYNKTQQRLRSPSRANPPAAWVRCEGAFEGLIDRKTFETVQKKLAAEKAEHERRYSPEDMLARFARLHGRYGKVGPGQIAAAGNMVSASAYASRFESLDWAYQRLHRELLEQARAQVIDELRAGSAQLDDFDDFVVLNERLSIRVQPAVPICRGYEAYWPFRPDLRKEVDITLGVPLTSCSECEIFGYLSFPRMMLKKKRLPLHSTASGVLELYGHPDLTPIRTLLE